MSEKIIRRVWAAVLCMCVLSACEEDYMAITNPDAGSGRKAAEQARAAYLNSGINWNAAADSVYAAFVKRFYFSTRRNGAEHVFSYSQYNERGGNGNCYWQQAHAMAAMVDWHNRIKDSDPATAATLRNYMSLWYNKRGNNYEGNGSYRGSTGFGNNFTDDTCWIIIALLQIYEATGDVKYYNAAKTTWDECVRTRFYIFPEDFGYLPWKWDDPKLNECTNGPAAIIAATLARYARQEGNQAAYEQYLEEAYRCLDFNFSIMSPVGTVGTTPLSYTQGTFMEACRLVWHLTGEKGYLLKGIEGARGQMNAEAMNEEYNGENLMRNEGTDSNNSIFHAVFYHWAARMIADKDIDAVDADIRRELYVYVLRHCWYYWTRGIDKTNWENSYFDTRSYRPRLPAIGGELGAYTSAAQAMETMCLIAGEKF